MNDRRGSAQPTLSSSWLGSANGRNPTTASTPVRAASPASQAQPLPLCLTPERGLNVSVDPSLPLRPQLDQLEDKIEESLDEVCGAPSVTKVNTGELIKIEETLANAAEAAKEAVSVRRRMRRDRESSGNDEQTQQPGA